MYWNIVCLSGFLSNLHLPWKTECALNWLYWIYIYYHSVFWPTCFCPEKQFACLTFFTVLNVLFTFRILSNLCLSWKTECALNSLHWIHIFMIQNFEQLAPDLKTEFALNFSNRGAAAPASYATAHMWSENNNNSESVDGDEQCSANVRGTWFELGQM